MASPATSREAVRLTLHKPAICRFCQHPITLARKQGHRRPGNQWLALAPGCTEPTLRLQDIHRCRQHWLQPTGQHKANSSS